jgi:hypothetical protein
MTKVKTQTKIVGEHFIVQTRNQIRYMCYQDNATEDLYLLECSVLSTRKKVLSFR